MSTNEQGMIIKTKGKKSIEWRNYTSAIGLVVLVLISGILSPDFFTGINLVNILKQIVIPISLAIGMSFVIILGGIDLSVGSIIALMATFTGMLLQAGMNWILAAVIVLACGALIGAFHGILVAKFNIPPFIATLAGYTAYKGLALLVTNSAAILITEPTFLAISSDKLNTSISIIIFVALALLMVLNVILKIKKSTSKLKFLLTNAAKLIGLAIACIVFISYGGVPILVIIAVVLFVIFDFILSSTVYGAEVYAIGGNKNAARLAGIRVTKRTITTFSICTFCATLGGILTASRLGSGAPQAGMLAELDAIAAVVIGGTSMTGGIGKLSGSILGVALIGVLNNMLSLLGASSYMQQIMKGVIILIAVFIDMQLSKKDSNK
jgi:ribose/xylose/arabinose/galactoside ABC-type transport system permease subunit